jgi:lipopolysaccharide transport system ATP-binding protein
VEVHGRVGSLLEVGTGFHPELTGRDNIYLNGSILGMDREYITRRFEEIVEFSGVGQFIDTPVKRYSSGMYLRLAFAVAAHLEPEILILDEVLAVGDAAFQKKCLAKMGEVAREGRTVLFVSHNLTAVRSLCRRAIWVHGGVVTQDGPASEVVSRYLATSSPADRREQRWDSPEAAPGSDAVRLRRVAVRPAGGLPGDVTTLRTPIVIEAEYWTRIDGVHLNVTVQLFNDEGTLVFASAPVNEPVWHGRAFPAGMFRSECHIPAYLLNNGSYRVQLLVVRNQSEIISSHDEIVRFEVVEDEREGAWHGDWPGVVRPRLEWRTDRLDDPIETAGGAGPRLTLQPEGVSRT